ncbi:LysR family transcriptional regulator ArgP [Acinetobacter sp. MB5]|uniref:LysR family transcriptional regulator ArgP n=1 Tax=Acinetobacter sp. MB5 TaxID=2069438 RepID=UPI000DD027D2|nr:LysR family transcriptional regulator ArgP [Acinetobacter sp. MB5]
MLDSKQCQAFLAVAETGSFEYASLQLHLTASAVSLRVQALERQLGQMLLIRGRPCQTTPAGEQLLQHLQRQRFTEQNFLQNLQGKQDNSEFIKVTIASNADSLATWLLPALQQTVIQQKIALEIRLDDQSLTHTLLEAGQVHACISVEAHPLRGCLAKPLGYMRYKMVATPAFVGNWFKNGISRQSLMQAPAVIFNQKDHMHHNILLKLHGLTSNCYPHHFIPSSETFVHAIHRGLGYGLVPDLQIGSALELGELIEIMPEAQTDILLYWHHWQQQSTQLQQLTKQICQNSQRFLYPA